VIYLLKSGGMRRGSPAESRAVEKRSPKQPGQMLIEIQLLSAKIIFIFLFIKLH
jgi:hypothetical protein